MSDGNRLASEQAAMIIQLAASRGTQSFRASSSPTVQKFIEVCLETVAGSKSSKSYLYNSMGEAWRQQRNTHLCACVLQMLMTEISLIPPSWAPYYYVFYRLVKEQVVLFELNTQILEIFGFIQRRHPDDIVCTPYLNEADVYPSSKIELMEWFCDGGNDADSGNSRDEPYHLGLLSVNNCLNPSLDSADFNKLLVSREVEANPLQCFVEGYSTKNNTESAMVLSLTTAYDITEEEAHRLVSGILSLYRAWETSALDPGHCVQILVPNTREALDEFVHLALPYGRPVTVYRDTGGDFAVETFDPILLRDSKRKPDQEAKARLQGKIDSAHLVSMREVLSCRDMAFLQARIIAHPRLFFQHGARANVFSADPNFSLRERIGQPISRILQELSPVKKSGLYFQKML